MKYVILLIVLLHGRSVFGLNNNQTRSPPLGWTTHGFVYGCNVDCQHSPVTCISETTVRNIAHQMVWNKYSDVGFNHILIGDCWSSLMKDPEGRLQPDKVRFPSGIRTLVDYVHTKGLKVGIYVPLGSKSVNGYPGIQGNEEVNIRMLQSWGIDILEFDGYGIAVDQLTKRFTTIDRLIAASINSTIVSCIWPYYELGDIRPNYKEFSSKCNLFKSTKPTWLGNLWYDVLNVSAFYSHNVYGFQQTIGAGSWNDPGLVQTGDPRLYEVQQISEYVIWSMLSAPIFISSDIHNINTKVKMLLQNTKVLEIGQDTLDVQAKQIIKNKSFEVWHRYLTGGDHAVLIINTGTDSNMHTLYASLSEMGVNIQPAYRVYDVLKDVSLGQVYIDTKISTILNSTETRLLRCYSEH